MCHNQKLITHCQNLANFNSSQQTKQNEKTNNPDLLFNDLGI